MRNMQFLRLTTIIAAAVALRASAQTPAELPDYPRVWHVNYPPIGSRVADNPNYKMVTTNDVLWGRWVGPYAPGIPQDPKSPVTAAWQIATDYVLHKQGQPMAIQLKHVGTLGLWNFTWQTTYEVKDGACRLYQHPEDNIRPFGLPPTPDVRVHRTPWMTAGINETRAWMETFTTQLAQRINNSGGVIPRPSYLLLDEEIQVIGKELSWPDFITYWQALRQDYRFKSEAHPVPGFSQSLNQIWREAGAPEPHVVTGPVNWRYFRGSEMNQRFWTFWSQVCHQAYCGAVDTAFYQPVRQAFPTSTGPMVRVSDYDQSLILDGRPNPEVPQNGPANSYISYEPLGGYGPSGQRFVWTLPYTTDIAQTPHFYGDFSLFPLQYFNGVSFGNTAWASSDDNVAGVPPPELWADMEVRMSRHRLDAMRRTAGGRNAKILPWTTLPNQLTAVGVDNGGGVQQYRGQRFPRGMPVRFSAAQLTRTLALFKSRKIDEFIIWNDTERSIDGTLYNVGTHAHWPQNWDIFDSAVSNAFGYRVTGVVGGTGTVLTTPPAGHIDAGRGLANLAAFSDREFDDPWAGRFRANGPAGTGVWMVTRVKKTNNLAPANLEFHAEFTPAVDARVWVYVRGSNQSTWVQLSDRGVKDANNASAGTFPISVTAGRTTKLRAVTPYNPAFFPAGGEMHLALYMVPIAPATPMEAMVDLVQVFGVTPVLRPVGDVNGDYQFTPADRVLLGNIIYYQLEGDWRIRPHDRAFMDFDRNGQINWNDLAAFDALVADGAGSLLIDDDRFSVHERPVP